MCRHSPIALWLASNWWKQPAGQRGGPSHPCGRSITPGTPEAPLAHRPPACSKPASAEPAFARTVINTMSLHSSGITSDNGRCRGFRGWLTPERAGDDSRLHQGIALASCGRSRSLLALPIRSADPAGEGRRSGRRWSSPSVVPPPVDCWTPDCLEASSARPAFSSSGTG